MERAAGAVERVAGAAVGDEKGLGVFQARRNVTGRLAIALGRDERVVVRPPARVGDGARAVHAGVGVDVEEAALLVASEAKFLQEPHGPTDGADGGGVNQGR